MLKSIFSGLRTGRKATAFLPYRGVLPTVDESSFVASNATVIGKVTVGPKSSIWYNAVIRGDVADISIGEGSNIQDGSVIHCQGEGGGKSEFRTTIGDGVSVGHMAMLHGCTIGNNVLIGMKATVLDGAVVEDNAFVAAGALVTGGKVVKSGQMWAGTPAKFFRELTPKEIEGIRYNADVYVQLREEYLNELQD